MQTSAATIKAVRENAGTYDASDNAVIQIEGPDAASLLHSLTTSNVKELSVGQVQNSALLDRKGKVLSLFIVLRLSEAGFLIILQPDLREWTISHLEKMRFMQKVGIRDASAEWGLIWVVGPQAWTLVSNALSISADQLTETHHILMPPDQPGWRLWKDDRWATQKINLLLPRDKVASTLTLFQDKGADSTSKETLDILRLEREIPEYGLEIDAQHILLEANLSDSFSRSKGCYPGQEVVERICAYGSGKTPNQLKVFFISGDETVDKNTVVFCGEHKAGKVVRSLYDPSRGETLVAAYIAAKFSDQLGTGEIRDGKIYLKSAY